MGVQGLMLPCIIDKTARVARRWRSRSRRQCGHIPCPQVQKQMYVNNMHELSLKLEGGKETGWRFL